MEIAERLAAVIAVSSLLASCTPAPSPTPIAAAPGELWTMYRGDLARDGHPSSAALDASGAAHLGLAWRARFSGAVDGTPAVARGLVIVGSAGGELRALNATDGQTVWSRHGLGAISSSPTIAGDRVFAGSLTGYVYAVDAAHGDTVWSWKGPADAAIWASPVVYGDEVIVGVASPYGDQPLVAGRLYGLDEATGSQRWMQCIEPNCAPGAGAWSTPSIDEHGTAFVGIGNPIDGVLAFDPLTGEKKWQRSLYSDSGHDLDVGASPVIFDLNQEEVVAQASNQGLLALLAAADGSPVWQRQLVVGSAVHGLLATPAYDGKNLYAASASPPTGLFAVNPADGSIAWRYATDLPVYSAPASGNGVVVFGTGPVLGDVKSGTIVILAAIDGRLLFTYDAHSAVRSGPAIAGHLVVVGDAAGDLFAFRPKS